MVVHEMRTDEAYLTLGLEPGSRGAELKKAFRERADRVVRPDSQYLMRLKRAHDLIRKKTGEEGARVDDSLEGAIDRMRGLIRYPVYCQVCKRIYGSTFVAARCRSSENLCSDCKPQALRRRLYWRMIKVLLVLNLMCAGVLGVLTLS